MLWSINFLIYFTYLVRDLLATRRYRPQVVAGAVADWYFTGYVGDSQVKRRGTGPLVNWLRTPRASFAALGAV